MNTKNIYRLKKLFAFKAFTVASLFGVALSNVSYAKEVAFEEDPRLPLVYINAAIKAGSVSDPDGESGITNFMGEMLLRGTLQRSKQQIDLALDQIGAKLEVETRAESLILRGAVTSSQLEPFLEIITEVLTQPRFPESEINKLKSEVISGIREGLGNDAHLASRWFNRFLFRNHPYGKPVIGTEKDVKAFTRDQIVNHYQSLVQDHLLLFIGTGDAKTSTISTWADQISTLRAKDKAVAKPLLTSKDVSAPKNPAHRALLIVDKPERTQTQIELGQIGIRPTDPHYFALYLGNHIFGGHSFSATLMQEIRVKRGWSYGAYSSFRYGLKPRSWQTHLFPASKDTASALELTLNLIKDVKEKGVTPAQFDFAKRSQVHNSQFMYNSPKKRVENALLEKTLDLPEGFMRSYAEEIEKVDIDGVNKALNQFLEPAHLAITVLGTAKDLKQQLAKATGVPLDEVQTVLYTADDL